MIPQLMQWGLIAFTTIPLEYHEMDHETASDWARKEIAGAAIYREWVGENDEELHVRGSIFPFRLGGLAEVEYLDTVRRAGLAQLMVRGTTPGTNLGWFILERFSRQHRHISSQGYGRQIDFEAVFVRVPVPSADANIGQMWQILLPAN